MTSPGADHTVLPHQHAAREATTMALYLAIVLLALQVGFGSSSDAAEEVALIWGTSIGLGVAHLFAFRTTAFLESGSRPDDEEFWAALGMAIAVVAIAALATIPYAIWDDAADAGTAASVLLMSVVGVAGYASARHAGATLFRSVVYTGAVVAAAAIVVVIKYSLTH